MTTASRKDKGRRLQQLAAKALLESAKKADPNLADEEIQSRSMGAAGVDLILGTRAQNILGKLLIECKNVESLNVTTVFLEHYEKYKDKGTPILVHKRNHTPPLVTITLEEFIKLNEGRIYVE